MNTVRTAALAICWPLAAYLVLLIPSAMASESYRATIEDRIVIQPKLISAAIDTVFFGRPVILVTTARGAAGSAFGYRIETQPLRIVDTLITDSTQDLRRALVTQLDAESNPDYLIAGDSTVRILLSGSAGAEGTLHIPGRVLSLAADAVGGEVWVGYVRDTSWTSPQFMDLVSHAGGLAYFSSIFSPGVEVLPSLAVTDLRWQDCNADGRPELLALCHYYSSGSEVGPGTPHFSDWQSWSYSFRPIAEDSINFFSNTLGSLTLRGEGTYGAVFLQGALLLTQGLGFHEAVSITSSVASGGAILSGSFYHPSLAARFIKSDSLLWVRSEPYGRPFLWDLDADGSPELLATHIQYNAPSPTLILDPGTGDSLGVVETDYPLSPWATAPFPDGKRRGFQIAGDTIIMFSISEATAFQESNGTLPTEIELRGNYPNPFNAGTVIEFRSNRSSEARITVFDALGRTVTDISATTLSGGVHRATWDGRNQGGLASPTGVYFYRVSQAGKSATGRMLLLR